MHLSLKTVVNQCQLSVVIPVHTLVQLETSSSEQVPRQTCVTAEDTGTKCATRLGLPESRLQGGRQLLGCEGREYELAKSSVEELSIIHITCCIEFLVPSQTLKFYVFCA